MLGIDLEKSVREIKRRYPEESEDRAYILCAIEDRAKKILEEKVSEGTEVNNKGIKDVIREVAREYIERFELKKITLENGEETILTLREGNKIIENIKNYLDII